MKRGSIFDYMELQFGGLQLIKNKPSKPGKTQEKSDT